jgi:hypothetical protein
MLGPGLIMEILIKNEIALNGSVAGKEVLSIKLCILSFGPAFDPSVQRNSLVDQDEIS